MLQVLSVRRFIAVVSCFLCNVQCMNNSCDHSSAELQLDFLTCSF
jgi:hypothetical protein